MLSFRVILPTGRIVPGHMLGAQAQCAQGIRGARVVTARRAQGTRGAQGAAGGAAARTPGGRTGDRAVSVTVVPRTKFFKIIKDK